MRRFFASPRSIGALASLGLAVACSAAEPGAGERSRATSQAIIGGTDSDASQDNVALIILYDPKSTSGSAACTGTFLTPRLVLTARHCVARTQESAACGSDGKPTEGGAVYENFSASSLYVFAGSKRPDFTKGLENAGRASEIIDDDSKFLCNHDIALILVDRPVTGAKIAPVRLDGNVVRDDKLTLVGWGIADKTDTPATRQQRSNVKVIDVGPADVAGPSEFVVDEGACSGDSGGPAFVSNGAVVGVLSRGGNGTTDPGKDGCVGGIDVYTRPSAFKDMILAAYAKAGQEPWREGEPSPLLSKLGSACTNDAECQTNACDTQAKTCSLECTGGACPTGYSCQTKFERKLCVLGGDDEGDGGCAASPQPVGSRGLSTAFFLAFAIALGSRRRSLRPR